MIQAHRSSQLYALMRRRHGNRQGAPGAAHCVALCDRVCKRARRCVETLAFPGTPRSVSAGGRAVGEAPVCSRSAEGPGSLVSHQSVREVRVLHIRICTLGKRPAAWKDPRGLQLPDVRIVTHLTPWVRVLSGICPAAACACVHTSCTRRAHVMNTS